MAVVDIVYIVFILQRYHNNIKIKNDSIARTIPNKWIVEKYCCEGSAIQNGTALLLVSLPAEFDDRSLENKYR